MTPLVLIQRLLCKLWLAWFHTPEIIETYDSQTRKLRCTSCGAYFAMSDREQAVLPWDEDYERIVCDMYGLPRTIRYDPTHQHRSRG